MKFTSAITLLALAGSAQAFAPIAQPTTPTTSTTTSLEVIRSKNFKNAKLVEAQVDTAGVVKAGVSFSVVLLLFVVLYGSWNILQCF